MIFLNSIHPDLCRFGLAGFIVAAYGSFLPQFVQRIYRQNVQFASTLVGITIAPSVLIGIIVSSLVADWIVRGHSGTRKRFQLRAAFLVGVVTIGLPIGTLLLRSLTRAYTFYRSWHHVLHAEAIVVPHSARHRSHPSILYS